MDLKNGIPGTRIPVKVPRLLLVLCILAMRIGPVHAQTDQDKTNRAIFDKVHGTVTDRLDLPLGDLVLEVARSMEGTPYVASTLEVEPERLQIFLDKTDCILFVETAVALAMTFKGLEIVQGSSPRAAEPSYELFCRNVQNLRYRDGKVDGYTSRLHYTSEWILQGEANGIFTEVTAELGSPISQKFSFMSTHPDSYRQLRNSAHSREEIARTERMLTNHGPYHSVSQERLSDPKVAGRIKDGDILAFVSTVGGLDITHVGIACTAEDGKTHFIHASTKSMKVVIEQKTLAEYAKTGVRVIKLN